MDEDHSDSLNAGDYQLAALEASTHQGESLPSDHLPNTTIRIEQEPSEEQTIQITELYFTDE